MYYKVSRDPLYSEIFMYPLEILATDTPIVQRLRYLSQLVGSQMSYPSATHTRFSHSLGVMHVSGLYASHLFGNDSPQFKIARLAGLLHDVGHGPFSHQFDEVVYDFFGYKEGHDEFREKLLTKKMPQMMKELYENSREPFKKSIMEEIESIFGRIPDDPFGDLMKAVNEVFEGEKTGSPIFNIVQGPLGADRMDFVLRDAYFSGVRYYGTVPMDRIIRNSAILKKNENEVLSYNIKTIDDMYTVLFGRFMMYKNVYFHKTSRAVDMMIQDLLRYSIRPLNLGAYLEDLDEFVKLTDDFVIHRIEFLHDFEKSKDQEIEHAYEIIERLKRRDLWKLVVEIPYTTTGIDPGSISKSLGEGVLKKMKKKIKDVIDSGKAEDTEILGKILEDFDDIFVIDTPYKLTLFYPDEFLSTKVYIHDGDNLMTFDEFEKNHPTYTMMFDKMLQLVRIYAKKDVREYLQKYNLIPKDTLDITTRW
ncbi:MAG: metal-dependent phosphohydrolase [Mesoaciditoga sp.]|uniref:HD domain-containing protein n=1 Tax=Athalassotoga sp. TaxID=2022597 RepID=UPI000CAF76F3|nr:MAG: metal-dependent phosphohydrolase [Mesoaciditoga sp.]PMP80801.1 MAG: metal-dependent phosphohydrolase [Mesoaciditoga sp.]HEU23887.1 HD domain-containing protein [Mesoaciditoga lauensis]